MKYLITVGLVVIFVLIMLGRFGTLELERMDACQESGGEYNLDDGKCTP